MRHGKLSREQAIELAGIEAVEKVENENCDFTNRLQTDGDDSVEFAASVKFTDAEGVKRTLTAYYYQDQEAVDATEDLSNLNWEIEGYEIW